MRRIFPDGFRDLDEEQLRAAYEPDRPSLRLNFVTSLDGAVEEDGYSRGLSGDADRKVFHLLRDHADAVMVGAGTLRHEGYGAVRLTGAGRAWRRNRGLTEYPVLVVVSASLDLDPTAGTFADAPVRPVVLTHAGAPADRRDALAAVADVVTCGDSVVDLAVGLAELRRRRLDHVLCEGGPMLFGALLASGLVDELCLTISPLLTGPGAGRIVAGTPLSDAQGMRLVHVLEADGALLTRYARA